MSGRTFAAILLVIILGIGATALGVTAYNAGVTAGLAQNLAQSGSDVVVSLLTRSGHGLLPHPTAISLFFGGPDDVR